MEVRAVRRLDHLSEAELRYGAATGRNPHMAGTHEKYVLHHLDQRVEDPLVEMPAIMHNPWNRIQHPPANSGGIGNGPAREAFNSWRERYYKARCLDELSRRGF